MQLSLLSPEHFQFFKRTLFPQQSLVLALSFWPLPTPDLLSALWSAYYDSLHCGTLEYITSCVFLLL